MGRAKKGTITIISNAHQTIHTKMIPKLWLPAGVPKKPVSMASTKKKSVMSIMVG